MSENLGTHVEAAAAAGWDACRKSIYAVCEDVQERAVVPATGSMARTEIEQAHEKGFFAGERSAAKSIARGFNSMEARDDNYFRDAVAALNATFSEPDFPRSIADVMRDEGENGAACGWRPCTGCHATNEGAETGDYPYSPMFQAFVGCGCGECGGIGVVWEYWSKDDLKAMAEGGAS